MKNYFIQISFDAPYPKQWSIRQGGNSFGTAIGRAIRNWKKEVKGKRIKEIKVKAIQL